MDMGTWSVHSRGLLAGPSQSLTRKLLVKLGEGLAAVGLGESETVWTAGGTDQVA